MGEYSYIDKNYAAIRGRLDNACRAAGREDVTFLAAIKSAEPDEILYLHDTYGITDVGENRVQQLLARYDILHAAGMRVHFIGSLQTNKVKYIIDKVCMIHSLDREDLAREIDRLAEKHGLTMDVLVEINSGREENKGGVLPEDAADFCASLSAYPHLSLRGFMTMAPRCADFDEYLQYFRETSQLVLDIWQKTLHNIGRPVLSMGMSESFEPAVAAGSTMVRIGRALFGKES